MATILEWRCRRALYSVILGVLVHGCEESTAKMKSSYRNSKQGRCVCALHPLRLDPLSRRSKQLVPEARLLPTAKERGSASSSTRESEGDVLVEPALAEPVMQLVILDAQLHIERLEHEQDRVSPVGTNARVSEHLDVLRDERRESAKSSAARERKGVRWCSRA